MSKKYTYKEVKAIVENLGFELISKEYLNCKEKLILKDKEGYLYYSIFDNIRNSYYPEKFNKNNPYSIQNIKLWMKLNNINLELLSKEYVNNSNKMVLRDIFGYYYFTSLNNIKDCSKFEKRNPYTIQNIKLWCKLNNKQFELVSDIYNGSTSKLKWKCLKEECGEVFYRSWDYILQGLCCFYCNCLANKNPELAKEWHPTLNGELTPYDVSFSSDKHVWWECSKCKNEWYARIADRNNERGCPECNKPKGLNHWNWKGGITPLNFYSRSFIYLWKRESMKNCNYRCVITGEVFNVVHHLYSFSNILTESLNELGLQPRGDISEYSDIELKLIEEKIVELHNKYPLGVCLTDETHKLFHSLYGRVNNTPEQFEEFKNNLCLEVKNNCLI